MSMVRVEVLSGTFTMDGSDYVADIGTFKVLGNGRIYMHKEYIGDVVSFSNNGDGTWHVVADIFYWVLADDE